jgi:hypothetical protein
LEPNALTHLGYTINLALVEQVNLTLRQAPAPLARASSFCKDRECMRQRWSSSGASTMWRDREPAAAVAPARAHAVGAICPRWQKRTPVAAEACTDHVWTFRELLTAKFEPLDSQSISG